MSAHTPGPWTVHPKWKRIDGQFGIDNVLVEVPYWSRGGHEEGKANLLLMASAPDLLAALSALLEEAEAVSYTHLTLPTKRIV